MNKTKEKINWIKGNKGLAEHLKCSIITAIRFRKQCKIPVYHVNGKSIYFKEKEVDRAIEKCKRKK